MKVEGAANAACVREEIVCIPPYFYQSPYLVLKMYLTRAQAAFAAVGSVGQFVIDTGRCRSGELTDSGAARVGIAITHKRLSWEWL